MPPCKKLDRPTSGPRRAHPFGLSDASLSIRHRLRFARIKAGPRLRKALVERGVEKGVLPLRYVSVPLLPNTRLLFHHWKPFPGVTAAV